MAQPTLSSTTRFAVQEYAQALAKTNVTSQQAKMWAYRKNVGLSRADAAAELDISTYTGDRHWANGRGHITDAELLTDLTVNYNDPAGNPTNLTEGTYQHMPVRLATISWEDDELLATQTQRLDWYRELGDEGAISVRTRTAVERDEQATTYEVREEHPSFPAAVQSEYTDRGDTSLFELVARWKAATDAKEALLLETEVDADIDIPPVTDICLTDLTLRDVYRVVQAGLLTKREATDAFETDDSNDALDIMDLPDKGAETDVETVPLVEGSVEELVRVEFSVLDLTTSITALFSMNSDPEIQSKGGDYLTDITYRLWRAGFERGIASTYPVRLPPNDLLAIASALLTNYHLTDEAPTHGLFEDALKSLYHQMTPHHQHEFDELSESMGIDLDLHERPDDH